MWGIHWLLNFDFEHRLTVLLVLKVPFLTPFIINGLGHTFDTGSVKSMGYALVHI